MSSFGAYRETQFGGRTMCERRTDRREEGSKHHENPVYKILRNMYFNIFNFNI